MAEYRRRPIRWFPALLILIVGAAAFYIVRSIEVWPYEQVRTNVLLGVTLCTVLFLLGWWLFFSRASWRARLLTLVVLCVPLALFRIRGFSGDFVPIIEFRFAEKKTALASGAPVSADTERSPFPQLFGPRRDARLEGPALEPDWKAKPPQVVWRIPMGPAWGGFVVSGNRAITQEQDGEQECVTCYELTTGERLWRATNPGRYETAVAGAGPRATPAISGESVLTLGALGILQCLDLATGQLRWQRDIKADSGATVPEWGFASSPLVNGENVIVSAGGAKSLLAYRLADGEIAWTGGTRNANYSSPFLYTLAGRPQIVMLNEEWITAHDPASGAVLWEYSWGKRTPHVARPIPHGDRRMMFSGGYGVGSILLEIEARPDGTFAAQQVWKIPRFQAKFATPVERGGFVYGVSDGIFACLDLNNGTVKWKDGRYGHGQALLVGEHLLQMTEQPGDLVLLRPTPAAANELARIPVFDAKTWNPLALSGELLLARNDQEAVCLRLPLRAEP